MKGQERLGNVLTDPERGNLRNVPPAKLWKTRVVSEKNYLKNKKIKSFIMVRKTLFTL